MKKVLTIAGSDSSAGAGIQADLKTFAAHGVYGLSVITAVTAQNTQGVTAVENLTNAIVAKQLEAIFSDIAVDAVKIGMVSQAKTISVIAEKLTEYKAPQIVVDTVMVSSSGYPLLEPKAQQVLVRELLPLAAVVTPNIPEAEVLSGLKIRSCDDMKEAACCIREMGPQHVLVKGGHALGDPVDVLFDGAEFTILSGKRINTKHTHGTGCTLSSAIAANLAKGLSAAEAVCRAKEFITMAIEHSLDIGRGAGPTHHFYGLYEKSGML
ncbi:MAG: bifunctional hydroxymethylpyrimidine kinase/phosphomethylpyrimidine kinase [Pelosinus sp.]|nr:bifunctional hydroxymethylpyrimidine kinase/phosphomethylpyrimidine kinase [Pelosinus sp.]